MRFDSRFARSTRRSGARAAALIAAACSCAVATDAFAVVKTFGENAVDWQLGASWTPAGVPTAADSAAIALGGNGMTLNADLTIQNIAYSSPSSRILSNNGAANSALTLDGSGTTPLLSVTGAGSLGLRGPNSGTGAGTLGLVLNASGDFNVTGNGGINISSVIGEIGGPRSITKIGAGAGALVLNGANTFSGDVTVSAGTLSINSIANVGAAQSLGTGSGTVILNGTLNYTGAGGTTDRAFAIGAGGLTIANAGDMNLTGTTTTGGAITKNGAGVLSLAGATTALVGAPTITINGGALRLDNTTNNNDRIGDTAGVTLNNGAVQFYGNLAAATAEVAGGLTIAGGSTRVQTTAVDSGTSASISFASLSRTGGVVAFDVAPGVNVNFAAAPSMSNDILGGWATHNGNDWASVDGANNVVAYSGYNTGATGTWAPADNVSVNASANVAASASVNSLRLAIADGSANLAIDPGATLNVSNGILSVSQSFQPSITGGGSITAGSAANHEMFVTVPNALHSLAIDVPIVDNGGGAVRLVKGGAGQLSLGAANTFTGDVNALGGSVTISSLSNSGTAQSLGMGAGPVGLGGATLVYSGPATSTNRALAMLPAGGRFSTTNDVTLAGVISGAGSFTKVGTGTVTLTGANTHTGGVNLGAADADGGVLVVTNDNRLGAAPATPTPNLLNLYGGTLRLSGGTQVTTVVTSAGLAGAVTGVLVNGNRGISINPGNGMIEVPTGQYADFSGIIRDGAGGTSPLHKIGGGTLDLRAGFHEFTGGVIVDAGMLGVARDRSFGEVPLAFDPDAVLLHNGATIKLYSNQGSNWMHANRGLTIGAGGGTVDFSMSSGNPSIFNQITSAAGNTFTKAGDDTVLAQVAQPNMNGDLVIKENRWNVQTNGAAGNGTIYLNAHSTPLPATQVAQLGIGGTLALSVELANNIVLQPNGGFNSFEVNTNTTLKLTGNITGTGGLEKGRVANTGGTLWLTGTNTYTGDTNIKFGAIKVGNGAAIPDASVVLMPNIVNVALDLDGSAETIGGLNGGGNNGGNVALGAGTLTIHQASSSSFGGTISGTGGSIVKDGTGILALARDNSYTGSTTMKGGILQVAATGHVGAAGNTLVFDGGTLQTTADIPFARNVTVNGGGGTFDTMTFSPSVANVAGTGGLTKVGTGTLTANHVKIGGALTLNEGKIAIPTNGTASGMVEASSITVAPSTILAMNDNDFIVNYDGASPEFQLRDYVKAFYQNENATSGISYTRGTGDRVIAVAEKSEWGKTEFNGVALDNTTIVGKYTYFGDANLDGKVDSNDYVAVDVGLGNGDSWVQGDFNFSGTVTSDDYVAIDTNLGKGITVGDPLAIAELKAEMIALHTAQFGDAYVEALARVEEFGMAALVPEPGALSLVGIGAAGLLGRRRRRA